jgi:ferredoxin, 2Fe-2S
MPDILIKNLFDKTVTTEENDTKTVLKILHENQIDWMHACGAKGRCTSCKMIVEKGIENLGPLTLVEKNYKNLGRLKENERLACQVTLSGNIEIKVPGMYKFPHISYSDY